VILIDAPEPLIIFIPAAVADVTDEPIATLIYSHGHSDRIGGARLLAVPGLEILAEEGVATFIRAWLGTQYRGPPQACWTFWPPREADDQCGAQPSKPV
jgi:glyoxylase-like metal-dependent hydrolase (beta-lactamase superfamily II)